MSALIGLVDGASFSIIIIAAPKLSKAFCKHILNLKISLKVNFFAFSFKTGFQLGWPFAIKGLFRERESEPGVA